MTEPLETLAVTFFETPVLAVRDRDGTILMSVRDLCDVVGLRRSPQMRRLRMDPDLREGLRTLRVMTAGGAQEQEFLILEFVPTWISSVNRSKATLVVQERLRYLRLFTIRQVYDTIARTAGLPEGDSRNIEDLQDLQRFDDAMQGIAARQRSLEESQERARQAWRDHEERLRQLEARLNQSTPITTSQRGHVYQLVQIWAQARSDHEELAFGAAVAGCWAAIKRRYDIAKYEHLPAEKYADCVAFIRRSYEQLIGAPLTGEQLNFLDADEQS